MDLTALSPFILNLANMLDMPVATLSAVFDAFLPVLIVATSFFYLCMEWHYRTLCDAAAWPEPIYRTISRPIECEPIWEHVQPDWRAA
jgi:hypothetical protein